MSLEPLFAKVEKIMKDKKFPYFDNAPHIDKYFELKRQYKIDVVNCEGHETLKEIILLLMNVGYIKNPDVPDPL